MKVNVYGLKCDNVACDYNDESIKFEDYEKYIEYPCPKCGCSLLTQEDYNTTVQIVMMARLYDELGFDKVVEDDKEYKVSIELDGTGVPKFGFTEL